MVLLWPAPIPPMVLRLAELSSRIPLPPLPRAVTPSAPVPIRLPCTVLPVALAVRNQMPSDTLPAITLPRMNEFATL